jgi:hypothetical protein
LEVKFEAVNRDIKALNTFKDEMKGAATQADVNRATLFGLAGIAIGVIGIVMGLLGK